MINKFSNYLGRITGINSKYIYLAIATIITFIIINIIKFIFTKLIRKLKDGKREFEINQKFNVLISIIKLIMVIIIWEDYIENFITLISFVSAAITIALRDIIFNFFSGIYIKTKKIFQIEDRIEINGYCGDVININNLNFELLELENEEFGGQSTGKIISLPNSLVFTHPVKNYNKAFKYIWDEIKVNICIDCDLTKNKNELYRIINNNEIIKSIPTKMKKEINNSSADYRLYFNKYDPIIYTEVKEKYIELSIRYLIHPKKSRFIKSNIWNNILISYKNGLIDLYKN